MILPMRPVSLFIFDLDGTLANTLEDIADSVNYTLTRLGRESLAVETVQRYVGDGILMLLNRACGGDAALAAEAEPIYSEHHRRNLVNHTTLYPSVKETLAYFSPLPMAVITNKTRDFSEPILERLGIRPFFSLVIGADSGLPLKPAPDSILKIVNDFGVPKDRTVIVGDGTTDARAGKASGIISCAVTYGFRSEEELRTAGPDHVIHEFSALKELFAPEM
ncbi:MAG TPA: hypothetical protein DCO77_02615 [Nitrospiraceae bacterium]|nr:hypothetical protein [Nitrospiraceae bacterium]